MPYVSAKYGPPPLLPEPPGAAKPVLAIDDHGVEWSLREDSQVGDWLRYIEGGGTIEPADPVAGTKPAPEAAPEAALEVTPTSVPRAQPDMVYDLPPEQPAEEQFSTKKPAAKKPAKKSAKRK